ncbi:hypothetical protein GCM10008090_27570 [Arenicella chitinivorans]|uniref:Uncharacterized protein n=1 Tax=Arenicella chitinivorans TaxID=1329800 RepID=A0A918RXF8_9GAMM|nr:hypothetical protein [Arenicella chitinivorans]GHA16251.1 hypothetical protein GCM10008090_27570 [Arenicella chitinivorans]
MDNFYNAPKADLSESRGDMPKLGWILLFAFALEGVFTIAINLLGSYDSSPVNLMSFEMVAVLAASLCLYAWICTMIMNGRKTILIVCYVYLAMLVIIDFQNWLGKGIFIGVGETLVFLNVVLLIAVVVIVKIPMRAWFSK